MALISLSPVHFLATLVVGIVLYFLTSSAYSWYRLRNVPGPFLASISYLWIVRQSASGQEVWAYQDLAKKYGNLIRISPNMLLTDDPELLRRMSGARSTYGKDGFYAAALKNPGYDHMFGMLSLPAHDQVKSKLAGAYGGRATDEMEPIVDGLVNELIRHLRAKASAGPRQSSVVDLAVLVNYFTLDVITRVAFGQEMGFLQSDSDVHGMIAAMRVALRTSSIVIHVPWLRDITTTAWFNKLFGPKPTDKKGLGVVLRIAQNNITERYEPGAKDQNDLLGAFVRHLPQGECTSEALFAMVAGSDTTASALRSTLLRLVTSPRVYRRLKDTVGQAVAGGRASSPITNDEARRLPYVQAVVYEGLRMRPPVPLHFPKVVPPEGDTVGGRFVPGGTAVGWNLLPMMRSPRRWGHDADIFRPERFTEAGGRERGDMERLVDMVFGYGRFRCAGSPLAFMELNKVFFELFRHFDFQLVNPAKPWNSSIFGSLFMETDFFVQVTESSVDSAHS